MLGVNKEIPIQDLAVYVGQPYQGKIYPQWSFFAQLPQDSLLPVNPYFYANTFNCQ